MNKIELGGGLLPHGMGFKNYDIAPSEFTDVVCDLNKKFPIENNSVDVIYTAHCIEHLNNIFHPMREIYRILKVGGKAKIILPYSPNALQPTHKMFFSWDGLRMFNIDRSGISSQESQTPKFKYIEKRFEFGVAGMRYMKPLGWLISKLAHLKPKTYDYYFKYWFPAHELHFTLLKVDNKNYEDFIDR